MKGFLEGKSDCINMKWILDLIALLSPVIKMCYDEISVSHMALCLFKGSLMYRLIH